MSVRFGPDIESTITQSEEEITLSFVIEPTVENPDEEFEAVLNYLEGELVSKVGLGIYRASIPVKHINRANEFSDILSYVGTPDTEATVKKM